MNKKKFFEKCKNASLNNEIKIRSEILFKMDQVGLQILLNKKIIFSLNKSNFCNKRQFLQLAKIFANIFALQFNWNQDFEE